MEMLSLTCHGLYDNDILKKNAEICRLRKELEFYKKKYDVPQIYFSNVSQWNIEKLLFERDIKWIALATVLSRVEEDDIFVLHDKDAMVFFSMGLFRAFNKLTREKSPDWCRHMACEIVDGIMASVFSLWKGNLLAGLNGFDTVTYLCDFISWKTGEGFIDKIPLFRCEKCNRIDNCVEKDIYMYCSACI